MVRYAEPTRGASLVIALKPTRILVVGSGSLAASRVFSALEADGDVLVASRGSIRHACEEVQWRVYHGDAEWLDAADAVQDDPDQQQTTFGALLDANPAIQLVCVTDTLNATEALPKRSAASAKAIARACRDRRIWVNVADMPSLCDFTFPATHRFALSSQSTDDPNLRTVDIKGSPLQLAVTANGHGCRLASRLKREVVARLPRNVGDAVDNVGRLRLLARSEDEDPEALSSAMTMHDSGVQFFDEDDSSPINKPVPQRSHDESPAERCARRMRWVAQLSEYTPLEQLATMDKAALRDLLESRLPAKPSSATGKCRRGRSESPIKSDPTRPPAEPETSIPSRHHLALDPPPRSDPTSGRIILVGSGPGHPALLTRAAHHAITNLATLVLADKLVPGEIMAIIPKHVEVKVAKKYPGNAEHAQDEFIQLAIQGARAGKCVVRLKQGDPYLYGRGGEELLAFQAAQPPLAHPPLVIPGISSALSAPLLSTIPVTQRNVADSLVICTAVGKGGKGGIVLGYERARSLVILMGVARLGELVRCLVTGSSEGAPVGGGVSKRLVGGLSSTKPVPVVPVGPVPPSTSTSSTPAQSSTPISISTSTPPPNSTSTSTSTPQHPSPDPNAPPTPITSPLTLSGPAYPPSTPIAIIERASMPDQRVIATSLDRIERALEREGGGRPPGMVIVGWAVVALAQSQAHSRALPSSSAAAASPSPAPRDGGILDIKGDGLGAYDEMRDRERLEQWLGGREYLTREGMEDGWEVFADLA